MNELKHNILLNLHSSLVTKRIFIRQNNTVHRLIFTFSECSEIYKFIGTETAQFIYKLPSGTSYNLRMTVDTDTNTVACDVPRAACQQVGNVECEIQLYWYDSDNVQHTLTSPKFLLIITQVIYDAATMASLAQQETVYESCVSQLTAMEDATEDCEEATAAAQAAAGNSVQYTAQTKTEAERSIARENIDVTELTNAEISAICVL